MARLRSTVASKRSTRSSKINEDEADEEPDEATFSSPESVKQSAEKLSRKTSLPSHVRDENSTRTSHSSPSPSKASTPDLTPKKSRRKNSAQNSPGDSKTRTLYSFFNAVTQAQRQQQLQQPRTKSETPDVATASSLEDVEDVIKDGSSDESGDQSGGVRPSIPTKRPRQDQDQDQAKPTIISGSNKFLKKLDGSRSAANDVHVVEVDQRPWNEKYGPSDPSELVVHKKKVADVRTWLENAFGGRRYFRLLILKGPAGSGKSITVSMLCKALGAEIVEWYNPSSTDYLADSSLSISAQLEEFLSRGSVFGGLELVSGSSEAKPTQKTTQNIPPQHGRQALVMEEFPNNLTRASKALHTFRSNLLQFLETQTQSKTPLILIISEAVFSDSSSSLDNFTAHRLLGPDILHHPSAVVLEFNPVAPTFIIKALKLVLQKKRRDAGTQYEPTEEALKKLSDFGDVRNAISTLEFICTQSQDTAAVATVLESSKSKSRSSKTKSSTKAAAENKNAIAQDLSLIALRETSIGLFHAIGRVLYNKRTALADSTSQLPEDSVVEIPSHLSKLKKPMTSEVDVDTLIDETGTDTSTFLSALHENYLLSCFAPDGNAEATLDSAIGCLDALADSDILISGYANPNTSSGVSGLRQSELAFQSTVRSMLFNLPYPVKRQPPPGKNRADAFRMFYPTSLKLWNRREEIKELTDSLINKAANELISIPSPQRQSPNSSPADSKSKSNLPPPRTIIGSGHSARYEMLLERLPYMSRMLESVSTSPVSSLQKQIEQVTKFNGIGIVQDEEEEPDENAAPGATTSPKKGVKSESQEQTISSMFSSSSSSSNKPRGKGKAEESLAAVEKLVLSDDDIEDD